MEISNIDRALLLELAAEVKRCYDGAEGATALGVAADRGADLANAVQALLDKGR